MADEKAPITEADLISLLAAKDEAQSAFSAATTAVRKGKEAALPLPERLSRDIAYTQSLNASCAADSAYDEALRAFVANSEVQV